MLINKFDVEVFTPPCDPGSERFSARARLVVDISEVMPFLNAKLRGAVYHFGAKVLTWKKGAHNISFHPYEIVVSNVFDRGSAEQALAGIIELVNCTWEHRTEITPDITFHQRPNPLALYKLLPHTDCRQCGELTCYLFALKLAASQRRLVDCPPLSSDFYAENRSELDALVIDFPAIAELRQNSQNNHKSSTSDSQEKPT